MYTAIRKISQIKIKSQAENFTAMQNIQQLQTYSIYNAVKVPRKILERYVHISKSIFQRADSSKFQNPSSFVPLLKSLCFTKFKRVGADSGKGWKGDITLSESSFSFSIGPRYKPHKFHGGWRKTMLSFY